MRNLLGWLVGLANANPQYRWYELKDRILERWATRDGWDLQQLECWGDRWDGCGPACRKCGGTGVYRQWRLDRYILGGRVFHRPRPMPPGYKPSLGLHHRVILGRVRHAYVSREASVWAMQVLHLLFDPRELLRLSWRYRVEMIRRWWRFRSPLWLSALFRARPAEQVEQDDEVPF